jgi:hypothetical protein
VKKFLTIAALLTAAIAMTASPAAGSGHQASAACDWNAADGVFSSLSSFDAASSARAAGDDAREPSLSATYDALPESAKGKGGPKFKANVAVWFHVVSPDGVIANVTQQQIDEQIAVMNLAFSGFYGGVNTGFKFTLAGVTRSVNADWFYAGPTTSGERAMKRALKVGGDNVLNYYSTTAGAYLGWAYFPGLSNGQEYLDGIVVDWESMPGTSTRYAGRYDLGQTATHETGHWVGLHHTFNGGCNNWGDYVEDTPPQRVPTSGCPEGQDTCKEPGLDPIHNYMDYSYDACYEEFTAGQAARAQDYWLEFRA